MDPVKFESTDSPRLARLWHAGRSQRDDAQRDDSSLVWLIQNVDWYKGPKGSLWYTTAPNPGEGSAVMHVLNDNPWTWKNFETSFLARLMDTVGVRKLYALVPKPAKKIKRIAKLLGFRHEGALREAVVFDGRRVSLEVFGLLRREVQRNGRTKNQPPKRAHAASKAVQGRHLIREQIRDERAARGARTQKAASAS